MADHLVHVVARCCENANRKKIIDKLSSDDDSLVIALFVEELHVY